MEQLSREVRPLPYRSSSGRSCPASRCSSRRSCSQRCRWPVLRNGSCSRPVPGSHSFSGSGPACHPLRVTGSCLKNAMQLSWCICRNNPCGCYTEKFRRKRELFLGRDASHSCDGERHINVHSDKKKSACI